MGIPPKFTAIYGFANAASVPLPDNAIARTPGKNGVNNAKMKDSINPVQMDALNTPSASLVLRFPSSTAASAAPPIASIIAGI